MPHLLSDDQKENWFEVCQELPDDVNSNKNFLKNIIAGDETWIYAYDIETKMQ